MITVLEYRRRQLGLTQRELARRAGISQGLLSLIETAQTVPSQKCLEELGAILEIDPTTLQNSIGKGKV